MIYAKEICSSAECQDFTCFDLLMSIPVGKKTTGGDGSKEGNAHLPLQKPKLSLHP